MVKEVNQNIFVNDWDYPDKGDHRCDDPEKKKLIEKLSKMITDSLDRKIPGGLKENHFDFWILDRLLTKEEVEGVCFGYIPYDEAAEKYDPAKLRDGFNTLPDGEEIFYISNPALGLWALKSDFFQGG